MIKELQKKKLEILNLVINKFFSMVDLKLKL